VFTQADLAAGGGAATWQELILPPAVAGPR